MRISDWSSDVCSSDLGKMADRKAIFIVEDEPMIGMMLEDFLETLGYAPVAIAETLVLAEEKAKSVPFDGAILDCNIGTEKVWPVADYLKIGRASCRERVCQYV